MEKKDNLSLYRETFLKKTHYTARDGKQVYIPVVYHEKMLKIVQLICSNRVNISDLLCNMLEEHFRTHGEGAVCRQKRPEWRRRAARGTGRASGAKARSRARTTR